MNYISFYLKKINAFQKLIVAFILVLLTVSTVTYVNSQSVGEVTTKTNHLIQAIPELNNISNLQNNISIVSNNLFEYYSTLDRASFIKNQLHIDAINRNINNIHQIDNKTAVINILKKDLKQFMQHAMKLDHEMSSANKNWDVLRQHLYAAQDASNSMKQVLFTLNTEITSTVATHRNETQKDVKQLNQVQLGFSIAVLIAAIFIVFNFYSRIKDQSKLFKMAYFNEVTQQPNRKSFERNFQTDPNDLSEHIYLFLGLDRFNLVTGSMGHIVGDRLIYSVAEWLTTTLSAVTKDYQLYHCSGTTWIIVLKNTNNLNTAYSIANSLLNLSVTPMEISGRELSVNCSIGLCLGNDSGNTTESLLRNLDTAFIQAKHAGGNSIRKYVPQMSIDAQNWFDTENALRYAVEKRELELFYQPKVNASNGKLCSSEALLRWRSNGEIVSPGVFIPIAESSRLIIKIGQWVLAEACKQWCAWQAQGHNVPPVAVNVSALQFQEPDFAEQVKAVIKETGIPPQMLELEITEEAAAIEPKRVVQIMNDLKKIGVSLAIDDFGTGYSSLSHLKNFPVDVLKIDRSFVKDLGLESSTEASIVKLILKLAHELNFKVVAEGVETAQQYQQLKQWQCDVLQGYFFSKPLPADAYIEMVKQETISRTSDFDYLKAYAHNANPSNKKRAVSA